MLRPALAITIDYGQRGAAGEVDAARAVSQVLAIPHEVVVARAPAIGMGDMFDDTAHTEAPSVEWWPFRNQLLVTLAAARVIASGATDRIGVIAVGSVAPDGQRHVDGTAEFYMQLDRLLAIQEFHLRVVVPGIRFDSVGLVRASGVPRDVLAWAHSCYRSGIGCGQCGGCRKLLTVFRELGWVDGG